MPRCGIKAYPPEHLAAAPPTFKSTAAKDRELDGLRYSIQVAPEDCTGCALCVDVCPARDKADPSRKALELAPQAPLRAAEALNWDFFLTLPETDRTRLKVGSVRQQQLEQPLFEFPNACAGCGEAAYLKLVSQLFGDRLVVANATGCSSIFGGNLPTTPWSQDASGRGPAWANSLFEDNAEFGLGLRLAIDAQRTSAEELLRVVAPRVGADLVEAIVSADQRGEAGIHEQRERLRTLLDRLHGLDTAEARRLRAVADTLVRRSVWIVGGDGWAYDIGFGGLDHVLASGADVNVLVLDTEVYSNTGGQMSKATPRAAIAKFAAGGKPTAKKDLGRMAMTYGNVYVAQVAMGARDEHTLRVFLEAEAFPGPSLIIAYSPCIAHGFAMGQGLRHQKMAVESGHWLLYRHDPRRAEAGGNPLVLDSKTPSVPLARFLDGENRFRAASSASRATFESLLKEAQHDVDSRRRTYEEEAAPMESKSRAAP